jgi:ectoine hydroxylase-related dioxygenase (phytanoyl-CoA dioxygenase family)
MKDEDYYGVSSRKKISDENDQRLEEVDILGYTILKDVLKESELKLAGQKIDEMYRAQQERFGVDFLKNIQESDLVRCPLASDDFFLQMAAQAAVLILVRELIGQYVILHLQNAIINRPNEKHHQSAWHRDLPYQEWVISKPVAISALFCIDDFSGERGATHVLPFSHKLDHLPSEEYVERHHQIVEASAGSVILFDSMLFHRAGRNASNHTRRAVNHVYAVPLLKQQIDLPEYLAGKYSDDEFYRKLLGYDTQAPRSDEQFKQKRAAKLRIRTK